MRPVIIETKPLVTITISGKKGAGKTTAARLIQDALDAKENKPFRFRIVEVQE